MAENSDRRALLGVLLLLVGALLILNNFNLIPFHIPYYLFTWPMILIIIGVVLVISRGNNSAGFFLITFGGLFLAMDVFHFSWRDIGGFWPIILVLIGIGLLIRNSSGGAGEKKSDNSFIDEMTLFGGTKKIINSQEFEGGKTTTLFGGTELILQNAKPIPGGAVVDTFTMFGGTDIVVPSDWEVKVEATAVLGGIDDKRETATSIVKSDPNKVLIIKGFVMFGGVEVKSYA
jgi:predicted membrane protein